MSAMASAVSLHGELQQVMVGGAWEDCRQALKFTDQNKQDPPEDPYKSLYSARERWCAVRDHLNACLPPVQALEDWVVLAASVGLQVGINHVLSEEVARGEEVLEKSLRLAEGVGNKVKIAAVSVQAYNQLALLWGNRGEQQKALEYLLKAKAVFESHIALPPPLTETEWLSGEPSSEWEREKAFESLHTHTLFYLAQVYGNLKQEKLSAHYCQMTLSRQLERNEYDCLEWSLNCATLSQYYLNAENFGQARHCLAASTSMLARLSTEEEEREEMREKEEQAVADVSRCWLKYCQSLLQHSRDLEEEEEEGRSSRESQARKVFRFEPLEVEAIESQVPCELVEGYEGAKKIFLCGQSHLDCAKKFYSLDSFASDYVKIVQDHSQLFRLLSHFEHDDAVKCRMMKRRIDMLSGVLGQLNPQHFLSLCRQVLFELGEVYSEMAATKTVLAADSPSPHAVGKINKLLHSSIQSYQRFVDSFADHEGHLPDQFEESHLRPVLCAKLYIARLTGKIITPDTATQVANLQTSLSLFKWILSYRDSHRGQVEAVFGEEVAICKDMADLLPLKIAQLQQ